MHDTKSENLRATKELQIAEEPDETSEDTKPTVSPPVQALVQTHHPTSAVAPTVCSIASCAPRDAYKPYLGPSALKYMCCAKKRTYIR
ncbi:hypothetical protein Aduo_011597 [Ancylostoma duodenale]